MSAHRCCLIAGILAAIVAGCEPGPEPARPDGGTDTLPQVAAVLHEAIASQVREKPTVAVRPEDVMSRRHPSAVVPGLAYHFAGYPSPNITHLYYYAVAAERGGTVRVIRTGADWRAMLGPDWAPSTPAAATGACEELLVVTRMRGPHDVVFARERLDSLPMLLPQEAEQALRRMAPPSASRAGENGWQVDFWVVQPREPRGAVKYRCTLPPARDPTLVAVDSLVFPPAQ